jgi:crotonobetainyl-CoA hydratase
MSPPGRPKGEYRSAQREGDPIRNVLFDVDAHVARVTLNRPAVMNAVDLDTERELQRVWAAIEADRDIRAVVLTGAGDRAFCAGADLKNSGNKTGLEYWAAPRPGGFGGIALRETLDVPVIARVNGVALGGGFEMVLGCDIVVACEEASFGLPEPRVGRLPLDGGMTLLQRQIPFRPAMGILLTGRRVPAREALALGIVNDVVARGELDAAVDRWVADIVACAPLSVRAIKQVVRRAAHLTAKEAQAFRLPALIEALESEDSQEGVAAFREKRAPMWKGR